MSKIDIDELGITPGPWRVTGAFKHIIATGEESTNQVVGEIWSNRKYTLNMNNRYNLSDANLIAAAPEMLEALISVRDFVDENEYLRTGLTDKIDSAIEKACYPKSWEKIKTLTIG